MRKFYSAVIATGIALAVSGCSSNPVSTPNDELNLNEKILCDIEENGIENVLATAAKYNEIAKKHRVEFKRLGMTNTQYIEGSTNALKTGISSVVLLDKKGKATKSSVSLEYAVHRACKFALGALNQEAEGKKTWRDAVPGDGFKY